MKDDKKYEGKILRAITQQSQSWKSNNLIRVKQKSAISNTQFDTKKKQFAF